jgi:hypothetical protein
MNILKELLSISQSLDEKGLVSLASRLDSVAEEMSKEEGHNKVLEAIIKLRDYYMLSESLTFEEALARSIIELHELSEINAEAVSGFTKDLVDNGFDTVDALEISIGHVLTMNEELSDAETSELSSSRKLLAELGLDEVGNKMKNINYEDSPLLIDQLEMADEFNHKEETYN